jgi:hypothetical protein
MNTTSNFFRCLLASVVLLSVGMLAGCKQTGITTTGSAIASTTATTTTAAQTPTPTTLIKTYDPAPYIDTITLNSVPKLGETAKMTFYFKLNDLQAVDFKNGLDNAKAWVEFWWTDPTGSYSEAYNSVKIPLDEVVVNGETSWEGDYTKTKSLHLTSTIKLPKAGIWKIEGYFTGAGWPTPIEFDNRVFVSADFAADMGSYTFATSSFAYLNNFPYGNGGEQIVPHENYPFTMGVDISKAPGVGETVTLSCWVDSLIDVPDFSITRLVFYKRTGDTTETISSDKLLINKTLDWTAPLTKNERTKFSADIQFPSAGEWEIYIEGNSASNVKNHYSGTANSIRLTITQARSFFGWAELPRTSTTPSNIQSTITIPVPSTSAK